MRRLFFLFIVGCTPERAPVAVPGSPLDAGAVDAGVVDAAVADVAIETAAPVASVQTIGPLSGPSIPKALAERLAREADAIPKGEMHKSPPHDAERDRAIQKRFGERCRLERTCGPLWGVDCQAAVDGPYFYVLPRPDGFHEITVCGGACMGGRCTNCPPKNEGWTCETY